MYVSLSNIHSSLDAQQFKTASEIMTRNDQEASAKDAAAVDEHLVFVLKQLANDEQVAQDVMKGIATLQPEQKAELEQVHAEFQKQIKEAIAAVTNLANQAQGGAAAYVNSLLDIWRRRAIISARRTGENPVDIYRRTAIGTLRELSDRSAQSHGTLNQLNSGVPLDTVVKMTSIQRKFADEPNLSGVRKGVGRGEKARVVGIFRKGVTNTQTGWTVTKSNNDFDEHLKTDPDSISPGVQYEAVAALPELMEKAVLVETYPDKYGTPEVEAIHRFYAPLQVDDDVYSVMLTVKQLKDGVLDIDSISSKKLYHNRIQKKMPSAKRGSPDENIPEPQSEDTLLGVTLRDLLRDVNDHEGNPFDVGERAKKEL